MDYLMVLGYGARDVIVIGDSAGGNMALSLVVKLKEEERLLPRGLVLLSPWTDLTASGKTHETRAEVDPVLDEEYLRQMTENYAAGQDYENPLISPLFADVTDFPPTYIQVGDNEVLLSDATMLHKKMLKPTYRPGWMFIRACGMYFRCPPLKRHMRPWTSVRSLYLISAAEARRGTGSRQL